MLAVNLINPESSTRAITQSSEYFPLSKHSTLHLLHIFFIFYPPPLSLITTLHPCPFSCSTPHHSLFPPVFVLLPPLTNLMSTLFSSAKWGWFFVISLTAPYWPYPPHPTSFQKQVSSFLLPLFWWFMPCNSYIRVPSMWIMYPDWSHWQIYSYPASLLP